MTQTILFDVNETLLSLSPVRDWFQTRFSDGPTATEWFAEFLRLSFVSSAIDNYSPFTELASHALATVVTRAGASVSDVDLAEVKATLTTLPAHDDVPDGLAVLKREGYRLAALTNSPLAMAKTQLANAGIDGFFTDIMSVEMVRRFKPHRSVYLAAAEHVDADPVDLVMVAAHDWDIAGAMAAGLAGAFIERQDQQYSLSFPPPTFRAPDIVQVARLLKGYAVDR